MNVVFPFIFLLFLIAHADLGRQVPQAIGKGGKWFEIKNDPTKGTPRPPKPDGTIQYDRGKKAFFCYFVFGKILFFLLFHIITTMTKNVSLVCLFFPSETWKSPESKIFVSLASLHDWRCGRTLHDFFTKAKYPVIIKI